MRKKLILAALHSRKAALAGTLFAFLLMALPADASIAFVNGVSVHSGATSLGVSLSVTASNMVVAACSTSSTGSTPTITDANITWTQVTGSPWTDSGTHTKVAIWTGQIAATQTDTITFGVSPDPNDFAVAVAQYSGAATSNVVDKVAQASDEAIASGSNIVSGTTGTTTNANEMLVGVFGVVIPASQTATWTAGAGYNLRESNSAGDAAATNSSIALEDQLVSSTGTFQAIITNNQTSSGSGVIVTLLPLSGGGGGAAGMNKREKLEEIEPPRRM